MIRFTVGITLFVCLVLIYSIAEGFGDALYTFETWLGSFLLPIWSIGLISYWHDIGREFLPKPKSDFLQSSIFIVWISAVILYVVWVYVQLWVAPLLLVIPPMILGFKDILSHKWDSLPSLTKNQWLSIGIWAVSSYLVYWVLTVSWILIRVWYSDTFTENVIIYMR